MKKIQLVMIAIMAFIACLFASEPTANTVRGVPISQLAFNLTVPQYLSYQMPALAVEDTAVTIRKFSNRVFIESINISVTDTVESQGDSVYFKLFIGADKILDQKTSAFKLPGGYTFTPLVRYTSSINSLLYYGAANVTAGQTSAITEGTYKIIIRYLNP